MVESTRNTLITKDYKAGRVLVCNEKPNKVSPSKCSIALWNLIKATTTGLTEKQHEAWHKYSFMPKMHNIHTRCKVGTRPPAQEIDPFAEDDKTEARPKRLHPKSCVLNLLTNKTTYMPGPKSIMSLSGRFAADIKWIKEIFTPGNTATARGLSAATRKLCGTEKNTPFALFCAASLFDTVGMALKRVEARFMSKWLGNLFVPIAATAGTYCRTRSSSRKPAFRKCVQDVLGNTRLFKGAHGLTLPWSSFIQSSFNILKGMTSPQQKTSTSESKTWNPTGGKDL